MTELGDPLRLETATTQQRPAEQRCSLPQPRASNGTAAAQTTKAESESALFFVPSPMPKRRKHRRKASQNGGLGERERIVKDVDEDEG